MSSCYGRGSDGFGAVITSEENNLEKRKQSREDISVSYNHRHVKDS